MSSERGRELWSQVIQFAITLGIWWTLPMPKPAKYRIRGHLVMAQPIDLCLDTAGPLHVRVRGNNPSLTPLLSVYALILASTYKCQAKTSPFLGKGKHRGDVLHQCLEPDLSLERLVAM